MKRPCLKGINTLIMSDSTLRAFARLNRTFPGTAIVAYSGAEILELSMIIRTGSLNKEIDLEIHETRERILNRRDEIPVVRWCYQCKDECYENFKGKILFCIGLNNSLHAADWPFVQENKQTRLMENAQVFIHRPDHMTGITWRDFSFPFCLEIRGSVQISGWDSSENAPKRVCCEICAHDSIIITSMDKWTALPRCLEPNYEINRRT